MHLCGQCNFFSFPFSLTLCVYCVPYHEKKNPKKDWTCPISFLLVTPSYCDEKNKIKFWWHHRYWSDNMTLFHKKQSFRQWSQHLVVQVDDITSFPFPISPVNPCSLSMCNNPLSMSLWMGLLCSSYICISVFWQCSVSSTVIFVIPLYQFNWW